VQEALDVWSLGVMAFELLTGEPALHMIEGKDTVRNFSTSPCLNLETASFALDALKHSLRTALFSDLKLWMASYSNLFVLGWCLQVMDRIEGLNGKELPWEGKRLTPAIRRSLGVFRAPILKLLSRDPIERPSMSEFCHSCSSARWQHQCANLSRIYGVSASTSVEVKLMHFEYRTQCSLCGFQASFGSGDCVQDLVIPCWC
jgi:serine/threonine protein kinase